MMTRRDVDEVELHAFLRGVEDALWLPAWASAVEEKGGRTPRHIRRETAAPMPRSVRPLALKFVRTLRRMNRMGINGIVDRASAADGVPVNPELLGYYLAMEGLGHGVSWTDDHEAFPLRLPGGEVWAERTPRGWRLDGYYDDTRFAHSLG